MSRTADQKLTRKISDWKSIGLIWETDEEIEGIYTLYLGSTHCENPKCNKVYKNDYDKCMDHDHDTNKFRNILCRSCNNKIKDNNTSGVNGIWWHKKSNGWVYQIRINGLKHSKYSNDKEWLIQYKEDFENKYLYISEN